MKKRIIFVSQALWLGGIETALVNLLNHLDYEKYDITCLITEDFQNMADRITDQCRLIVSDRHHRVSFSEAYKYKKIYDLMEKPRTNSRLRLLIWKVLCLLLKSIEMKLYSRYIRHQLDDEKFDTAVIYSDRVAEITTSAIDANRYLMFYHNADIEKAYHDECGYRKSEKIIAVSETQCEKLKKARKKYKDKIIAINNYIDTGSTRAKALEAVDYKVFEQEGYHIVSCGRLAHQKGFDIAIDACSQLVKEGCVDLHWYILGNGPLRDELLEKAKLCGVSKHIHFLGAKDNPFIYMTKADLYVQPSRTEGYSLSILEARVLACPMVATHAAAGEQLHHGEDCTLCDTDAVSIASAIRLHIDDPGLSSRYSQVLKNYDFDEVNHKIISQIEELL